MLTKRIWVYAVAVAAAMGACKPSGPQTTESGLTYEVFRSNDEGTKLDSGLIGLVYMKQYVIKGTDTINQRIIEEPTPIGIGGNTDPIMEGLRMLHKGDSAKFSCDAAKLFTGDQGVPPGVPADAQFHFYFGISEVFDQKQFEAYQAKKMEESMAAMKARMEKEEGQIKEYLAANNLTAQRSENGIYTNPVRFCTCSVWWRSSGNLT